MASPSIGLPRPSNVLPSSSSPTLTVSGFPVFSTRLPIPTPTTSLYGISNTLSSRNPITSAIILDLSSPEMIQHISPSLALGPMDSKVSPTTLTTFPKRFS